MDHLPTISEVKYTIAGERLEYPCRAIELSADSAVVLYRLSKDGRVKDLSLPAGTLSLGYFWAGRPYNVYHWLSPEGNTLGYYINIGEPLQIGEGQIIWKDLVVDLLVSPGGEMQVLDEDELPADLDPALRRRIMQVRDDMIRTCPQIVGEVRLRSEAFWQTNW